MPKIVILLPAEGATIDEREFRQIDTSSTKSFQEHLNSLGVTHNLVFNQFLTKDVFNTDGTVEDVYNRYSDKAVDNTLEVYLSNKITFKTSPLTNTYLAYLWAPNNGAPNGSGVNTIAASDTLFNSICTDANASTWRLEGTDTELTEIASITNDIVLEPVYTVTLYSDGVICDTIKFDGTAETILPTNLEKDGFEFAGWYDNQEFTGDPVLYIEFGDIGDKKFYAKWNVVETPDEPDPELPDIPSGNSGAININSFLESVLTKDGVILMYNYGENSDERKLLENNDQIAFHENYFKMKELNEVELNLQSEEYVSKFTPDGKIYCKEFREIEKK